MKANVVLKRLGITLFICLFGISFMAITAFASGSTEPNRETSLSVYFGEDGEGFSGVEFSVYRVASISADGTYMLTEEFTHYPVSVDGLDSSGWRALAQTLDSYVTRDGLMPLQEERTGQDGWIRIAELPAGLYLVIGNQYRLGNTIYTPEPILISLPGLSEDGQWIYDVKAICKFDRETIPDVPYTSVSYTVQKVWRDGEAEDRPAEIRVQLLRNGAVVDTVILSKENNWSYTWRNLNSGYKWQVVEAEVPDGYTVSVEREGRIFVVTNTRPDEPDKPNNPDEPDKPEEPDVPPPTLPQTGLLWWPVPLLMCSGLLLLAAGLIVLRRQRDTDEK